MNFDSHVLTPPPEAFNVNISEVDPLFDQRIANSPLPSTPLVAYADPPDVGGPFSWFLGGFVYGHYELPASADITQLDVAYIVTDSTAGYEIFLASTTDTFGIVASLYVPEPTGVVAPLALLAAFLRRPSRERRRVAFETLEPRRLLSIAPPVFTSTVADPHGVDLAWNAGRFKGSDPLFCPPLFCPPLILPPRGLTPYSVPHLSALSPIIIL